MKESNNNLETKTTSRFNILNENYAECVRPRVGGARANEETTRIGFGEKEEEGETPQETRELCVKPSCWCMCDR